MISFFLKGLEIGYAMILITVISQLSCQACITIHKLVLICYNHFLIFSDQRAMKIMNHLHACIEHPIYDEHSIGYWSSCYAHKTYPFLLNQSTLTWWWWYVKFRLERRYSMGKDILDKNEIHLKWRKIIYVFNLLPNKNLHFPILMLRLVLIVCVGVLAKMLPSFRVITCLT